MSKRPPPIRGQNLVHSHARGPSSGPLAFLEHHNDHDEDQND